MDAAATNLQAKKNALERLGDKASLNALIGSVKSLKQAEYTTASWAALQTSLANAEAAAGSNDVSQAEVDAARDALAARKDALVKRGDKTALNAAIQAAQELAEEDYTAETWALLQEALNGVRQAAADEDATEAEVADAEKMLQEAVGALEKLTFTVTLNPQNGSDVITLTVKKGEKAKAPQSPQKEGYDFEGWFANGQDMAFDFASTPITADITLTAKWKESQTGSDPGDNPGGDNPGGDNPGGDNPGGDNPGGDNPEIKSNISEATVTLAQTSYVYDGKAKTPSVTVKLGDKTLVLDTDYTVSYIDNIEVGTAKVIITAKGNYTGSKTTNFTITKAADQEPTTSITCKKTLYEVSYGSKPFKIKASSESSMTFTSFNPKIAAVDKATGKVTIKSTGIAVISIYARNAAMDVTVKVSPKKQTIKSIKAVKGKKLTVKWANDKMASGYQVQISTDKSFKKNVQAKKVSKTSHTFTKLKIGKKYYVKVRSYKKVSKESLYGTWSKMETSSKIKK